MKSLFPWNAESDELPLAPFLDVIFILLIFVLVSTQMIRHNSIAVNAPESGTSGDTDRETINVDLKEGTVRVESITGSDFIRPRKLRGLLEDTCRTEPIFLIRADASVNLQEFVSVLDALEGCGSTRLLVRSSSSGGN